MLHAIEVPHNAPGQIVNLLGGLASVRSVGTVEQ
jgi:hypothetical protein